MRVAHGPKGEWRKSRVIQSNNQSRQDAGAPGAMLLVTFGETKVTPSGGPMNSSSRRGPPLPHIFVIPAQAGIQSNGYRLKADRIFLCLLS